VIDGEGTTKDTAVEGIIGVGYEEGGRGGGEGKEMMEACCDPMTSVSGNPRNRRKMTCSTEVWQGNNPL
jgi:hypothetical protein